MVAGQPSALVQVLMSLAQSRQWRRPPDGQPLGSSFPVRLEVWMSYDVPKRLQTLQRPIQRNGTNTQEEQDKAHTPTSQKWVWNVEK